MRRRILRKGDFDEKENPERRGTLMRRESRREMIPFRSIGATHRPTKALLTLCSGFKPEL
jgi:hypothetical protein